MSSGKQLGEKNKTIWPDFVKYSLKHLKKEGYLLFINPLSWLKKSHCVHDLLLEKKILWMKLWDDSNSKKNINADIPISFYLLKNQINVNHNTIIISELFRKRITSKSKILLDKEYSIPLAYHTIFEKLLNKIRENNLKLNIKTKTVKGEGKSFKLPKKYTIDNNLGIDTFRIKDGYFVKYMKTEHIHALKRKLILANKASLKGSFIDQGNLGLVGNHKFYITGNKLEMLQSFLESNLCTIICQFTRYGQHFLDKDAFTFIPDIRKIFEEYQEYDINFIYKYFDFTDKEIEMIENFN